MTQKVVFPSFRQEMFSAAEMRQLVSALEIRFQSLEQDDYGLYNYDTNELDLRYAQIGHTHVSSEITDLNTSIFGLDDVTGTPSIGEGLIWNGTAFETTPISGGGGAVNLNDLTDVNAFPTDGQALVWDAATLRWVAEDQASGGVDTLVDLTDTDMSGQQTFDLLFNAGGNTWEPTGSDFQWVPSSYIRLGNTIGINWYDFNYVSAELLAMAGGQVDPIEDEFWDQVVLLLPVEEADGSTTTVDVSNSSHWPITFTGVTVSTDQSEFGTASLKFDGVGTDYVTIPDSPDFDLGDGAFTLEVDVYYTGSPSGTAHTLIGQWDGTGNQRGWRLHVSGISILFQWTTDGTSGTVGQIVENHNMSAGEWYRWSVNRNPVAGGGTLNKFTLHQNGVFRAQNNSTDVFHASTADLVIGANGDATQPIVQQCYIDNVRLTVGNTPSGRYPNTSNYPQPTDEHPQPTGDPEVFVVGDPAYRTQIDGSRTTITGDAVVDETLSVAGATDLGSTLNVVGATDLGSTLNVDGAADFRAGVTIHDYDIYPAGTHLTLAYTGQNEDARFIRFVEEIENAGGAGFYIDYEGLSNSPGNELHFGCDKPSSAGTIFWIGERGQLRLEDNLDIGLTLSSTDHPLQIGPSTSDNLRFDRQGIQYLVNGTPNTLRLNEYGGGVYLNSVGYTTTASDLRAYLGPSGRFYRFGDSSNLSVFDFFSANNYQSWAGSTTERYQLVNWDGVDIMGGNFRIGDSVSMGAYYDFSITSFTGPAVLNFDSCETWSITGLTTEMFVDTDLRVSGDLTVSGTTTTINSNTVAIADNIILLNSDAVDPPTENAGLEIERGGVVSNVFLRWNETSDRWEFTNDGTTYYNMLIETEIDHTNLLSIGTNTHAQIDTHIADGTIHFTQAAISIPLSQINDVTATAAEVNLLDLATLTAGWVLSADTATTASWKQLSHTLLGDIGVNTHAQIDTHLADGTIHFTQAAISIPLSQINDVTATAAEVNLLDLSALTAGWVLRATGTTTAAWGQLAHGDLSDVGTNTHAQIDTHIGDTSIHFDQIGELSDVVITTVADRHVLVYDGVTDNRWENRLLVEADISDLQAYLTAEVNDLSVAVTWANVPDANITQSSVTQHVGAIDHDLLLNFTADEHFTKNSILLDDLFDVTETTITTGDVLRWNGAEWVNYADSNYASSSHTHLLAAGATDVTATAAEVNLLDLAGLTVGWGLVADSATTASWQALPSGATNLTWTASTRTVASDTGTDAVLTLFTATDAGLAPLSGGGTTNYLRADGTWAAPPGGTASNSFETHTVTDTDSGFTWAETGSAVADSATDTLTWVSGAGIDIDVDATSDAIRIRATGAGTIGGSITDNQIAVGAATADDIEGSAALTFDGTRLNVWAGGQISVDAQANVESYVQIGPADATLRGVAQDGKLILTGESGSVVYGSQLFQQSAALRLQGNTFGGATAATILNVGLDQQISDGKYLRIQDVGNTDYAQFSHDGTDFNTAFVNTTDWNVRDGVVFKVFDSTDSDYIAFNDSGTSARIASNNNPIGFYPQNSVDRVVKIDSNSVDIENGFALNITDDDLSDLMTMSHSGGTTPSRVFTFNLTNTDYVDFTNIVSPGGVRIRDGAQLEIYDSTDTNYLFIKHTGTDVSWTGVNTDDFTVDGLTWFKLLAGGGLAIYDSTNNDEANFSHDGVDFNTNFIQTTDWNISGATNVRYGISTGIAQGKAGSIRRMTMSNSSTVTTTWYKICEVSIPSGVFQAQGFWIEAIKHAGNHGQAAPSADVHRYAAEYARSGAVEGDDDTGRVIGNGNLIRMVRTALGEYELQFKPDADNMAYTLEIHADTGGEAVQEGWITWFDIDSKVAGATVGTIYTATGDSTLYENRLLGTVRISGGSLGADYADFSHDGTDFNTAFTNTTDWDIDGIAAIKLGQLAKVDLELWEEGQVNLYNIGATSGASLYVTGADLQIAGIATTNIDITGFTSIQAGTVDADFDAITATSYGGITEANLVDKTATETISGSWTFTNANGPIISTGQPELMIRETDAPADEGNWVFRANQGVFRFQTASDAAPTTSASEFITFNRVGTAVDTISLVGVTTLSAGSTDADFDAITATSYGGIAETNLVNKTATELITGSWNFDTDAGVVPLNISRNGNSTQETLQVSVADRTADFRYIEDTASEGVGNFGDYRFILTGNSAEGDTVVMTLSHELVTIGSGIDLTVGGDLTVSGTTTTINSNTVSIADNLILLNSDEAGAPTQDAGLEIERGTSANVFLQFDETSDRWEFTNDGSTYYNIPISTEQVPVGTTTDATLRWSGSTWLENTSILASAGGLLTMTTGGAPTIDFTNTGGPIGIRWSAGKATSAQVDLVYRTTPETIQFERVSDGADIAVFDPSDLSTTLNSVTWTGGSSANANTAFGWGDHAVENYLKNIVEDTSPQLGANLSLQTFYITDTNHGREGNQSLEAQYTVASDWYSKPVGYHAFMRNTTGTAGGAPVDNYGYFEMVAHRDSSNGWGGIWVGYTAGENYMGRSSAGGFATWDKLWSDVDFTSSQITNWDTAYNDKINSASFATGTGILTLTQQDAGTVTVDLDGRYAESGGAYHDGFSDYVANEHIDWTSTSSNLATTGTIKQGSDSASTVHLQMDANSGGFVIEPGTTIGGWARGHSVKKQSDATVMAGAGFLGSNESVTSWHVGFGASWWATDDVFRITPTVVEAIVNLDALAGIDVTGALGVSGVTTAAGGLSLDNGAGGAAITNVGSFAFNDPGPNEGITWTGGNFSIYESPNDLATNTAGNLQFVSGGVRRATIDTSGGMYVQGTLAAGTVTGANVTSGSDPGHTHTAYADTFDSLTSKGSGTGDYLTTGDFGAGENSGGPALTINDGYGNSNLTFNHRNGTPDNTSATQSACRIEASTDSNTASLSFELGNSTVQDTPVALTQVMEMTTGRIQSEVNHDFLAGIDVTGNITVTGTVDSVDIAALEAAAAKTADNETITGNWTFQTDGSSDFVIQRQGSGVSDASVIRYENLDGLKGYAGFSDDAKFSAYDGSTNITFQVDASGVMVVEGYYEAKGLGPLTTPGTDDLYVGGYGIMGDRNSPVYVSNVSGPVSLGYAGVHGVAATALSTQQYNLAGNTSSVNIEDHSGNIRDAGFNDIIEIALTADLTLNDQHAGACLIKTSTTSGIDIILPSVTNNFPEHSAVQFINAGNSTVTINAATNTRTLYWPDGSTRQGGASTNRTIAYGGVITIWRQSSTTYYVWGSGIS